MRHPGTARAVSSHFLRIWSVPRLLERSRARTARTRAPGLGGLAARAACPIDDLPFLDPEP
jgi:hypothetical protein